jgi:transcriptional regulator with XRE-family HTH domain
MRTTTAASLLSIAMGARLREARLDRGLTQADVARLSGSHRPIVARTELGKHLPDLTCLVRHGAAVGVGLAEIGAVLDGIIAAGALDPSIGTRGPRAGAAFERLTRLAEGQTKNTERRSVVIAVRRMELAVERAFARRAA